MGVSGSAVGPKKKVSASGWPGPFRVQPKTKNKKLQKLFFVRCLLGIVLPNRHRLNPTVLTPKSVQKNPSDQRLDRLWGRTVLTPQGLTRYVYTKLFSGSGTTTQSEAQCEPQRWLSEFVSAPFLSQRRTNTLSRARPNHAFFSGFC